MGQHVQVAPFHVRGSLFGVRRHIVHVDFQGIGSGILQVAPVGDPAVFADAIEACDDRYLEVGLQGLQLLEVVIQAGLKPRLIGEKTVRLAVAQRLVVHEPLVLSLFGQQLLFEQ